MRNINTSDPKNVTGGKLLGIDSSGAPAVFNASSLTAQGNPYRTYATKALATADLANIPADALVYVNADSTATNNGFYAKTSGALVQSSYDRVVSAENNITSLDMYARSHKNGVPLFMYNDIAQGTVVGNRVDFAETELTSNTNNGFALHTGTIDPYVMEAIRDIKRLFGAEPKAYALVEHNNIVLGKTCYIRDRALTIANNLVLVANTIRSGLTEFSVDLPIGDATSYLEFKIITQVKTNTALAAWLKVVSASIYYEEEIFNNYLFSAVAKRENTAPFARFDDVELHQEDGVSIVKHDDTTLQITIPKGTPMSARQYHLHLDGFHWPLLESAVNDVVALEVIADGIDFPSIFSFGEIAVEVGSQVCEYSLLTGSQAVNYQDDSVSTFYKLKTTAAKNVNFHNSYGYDDARFTIGSLTAGYVAPSDLTFTLRLRVYTSDKDYSSSSRIVKLEGQLRRLREYIGAYETKDRPVCKGLTDYTIPESATLKSRGVVIPATISEVGTVLEYGFSSDDYRLNGITIPTFSCGFICNRSASSDIALTAEVVSETGLKIQDADVDFSEIYNGVIKVSFELYAVVSTINNVRLRITVTSSEATGLEFYMFSSEVLGLSVVRTISDRLYDLDYTIKDTVVKSPSGTKFRIAVDDSGTLSTQPYTPSKMMVLSHSWGLIPASPSIGWYGDWSLASSTLELGLHSQIQTQLQTIIPDMTAFFQRFATFAAYFNDPSSWGQFNMSHLDFDSIMILSFMAGPVDDNWTGFGAALVDCITNYVCAGKTGVRVYMGKAGNVPTNEFNTALSGFGTTEIDTSATYTTEGTGWPWKMPDATDGTPITKVPADQPASEYVMNGQTVSHPGNYGYYAIAKNLKNQVAIDYSLVNTSPTLMTFAEYKAQPAMTQYIDPLYPYS